MDPFSFAIATVAQIGISMLFPSEGPRLKDLKMSASTYGASIPEAFGVARVAANMIWSDKIREHKKKKTVGLKTYKYYVYTCTFAMGVCAGPITAIRRIWANYKLIYDATGESEVKIKNKTFKIRTYNGTEDQLPNSEMERLLGEGQAPAFRGLAYIVFEDMRLEDFGNTIPQISVEVFAQGDAEQIGLVTPITPVDGNELNYVGQTMMVDPDLGYMYVSSTSQPGGIRRFRLSDGQEDFQERDTLADARTILGISPSTGNLIVQHGTANSVPMSMNDPVTLGEIARIGYFAGLDFKFGVGDPGDFAIDAKGNEYCLYPTLFKEWNVFPTYPEERFVNENFKVAGVGFNGVYGHSNIAGVRGSIDPTFYIWDGADASGGHVPYLRLYAVTSSDMGATWDSTMVYQHDNPLPDNPGIDIGFDAANVLWDAVDGNLLLVWHEKSRKQIGKFDPILGAFIWTRDIEGLGYPDRLRVAPLDGELMWSSGTRLFMIDTLTGEWIERVRDPYGDYENPEDVPQAVIVAPLVPYNGIAIVGDVSLGPYYYDSSRLSLVTPQGIVRQGESPATGTSLAAFIERLLRRGGLSSTQFDLSGLQQQNLRGYAWASGTDIKSIIEQLRMIYLFDLIERNGKIVGVLRDQGSNELAPGAAVRNLTQSILGNTSGDTEGMDYWQETRLQEADLPQRISLSYMNWEDDFATSTAVMRRMVEPLPTMFSHQQVAMEIGVVMTPTEAKNQVAKMLWSQWGERMKHNTRLPWAYLDLDPADVITVTMDDGRRYIERVHQMEFGADFALATETYAQDSGAYVASLTGDGGGKGGADGIEAPRPAKPFIMNTPLLRDQDDTGGNFSLYYTGVGNGRPEQFEGAGLYRSTDNLAYDLLYSTDQDVEWGQVTGRLPTPRHGNFALDWLNKVTIWPVISWFELESITDDELWAGGNLCMVGNEVIQFRDCVQNPNGSWTIWNLLRGRRGTEYACDTHKVGESFVFLAASTIVGEGEGLDARGQSRYFRAVGEGRGLDESPPLALRYEPRDLMPYAPADIRRSAVGTSFTLDWSRRTRMGGNMQDFTGTVPLNEIAEKYEVYILSAPYAGDLSRGGEVPSDNVIFTAETTAPTLTWDVSAMAAPFDVNLDTLHVLIYQVSSAVGRGFPGIRSIEHWQDF